ncbi:MAG: spore cortex biosynthesis protein YabQ [Lachnospiraceae bacterium]|nr:spore cortex biosynthesis protein YabQ [Lachnospiraceae bacterium]
MFEIIYSQGNMFVVSLIMGICMGAVYDVLRSIRKNFNHSDMLVGIEDIIYWLFFTWLFIENIFKYNDGSFRIYIFVVAITGLVIYKNTISSGIFKLLNYILYCAKKCVEKPKKMLKNGVKWYKMNISIFRYFKNNKKEKDAFKSSGRGKDEQRER